MVLQQYVQWNFLCRYMFSTSQKDNVHELSYSVSSLLAALQVVRFSYNFTEEMMLVPQYLEWNCLCRYMFSISH